MSKTRLSSEASPLSSIWVFLFYSLPPSTPSSSPAPVTFSLYFAPSIIIPLSGVAGCKEKKKRKKEKTGLHVERNPTFSYWNTKPTAVKCSSKTQTTATHIFLTFILSGESMCALCLTHCCTHSQWDLPPVAQVSAAGQWIDRLQRAPSSKALKHVLPLNSFSPDSWSTRQTILGR